MTDWITRSGESGIEAGVLHLSDLLLSQTFYFHKEIGFGK